MKDSKKQLEEANEIISLINKGEVNYVVKQNSLFYANKYLKPVDPLKEKWQKFADEELDDWTDMGTAFPAFKIAFAEDLNGTKGLDELKALITGHHYTGNFLHEHIERIKKELEA